MKKKHNKSPILSLVLILLVSVNPLSAVDFVFNGFHPSDLLLYGIATVDSRILTLTNKTSTVVGRALYKSKIKSKSQETSTVIPFSTSFIFSIAPYKNTLPGHGFVFIFAPATGINGTTPSQHLGLFNLTNNGNFDNHVFGVEFDVFANQEFDDIDDNHVGVNVNSLKSNVSHTAGFWPDGVGAGDENGFEKLKLNNGENYQVWIDYADFFVNVTMVRVGHKRPKTPLLSVFLNLSDVFLDEMYVGFTAATGRLVQSHRILAWSFSNTNFSMSKGLITTGLPSFVLPKDSVFKSSWFIGVISTAAVLVVAFLVVFSLLLVRNKRQKAKRRAEMEEWEFEYWPHRITYQELEAATDNFSDSNVIGVGGNGKVYKGVLAGNEVAVKRISHDNEAGMREFLAEISSLGRLKHRSLVGLRGWCKKEKGSVMLVYDYMENGSLDMRLFDLDENKLLSYEERLRILKDVAAGVLYLHEGWEAKVLHRDIKASNVLLDKDMNGRLGDFGLARTHDHGQAAQTTRVVGTVGYLAPEVVRTGRVSAQTDVFGFGVLILEVMCGRRPIEEGKPNLVDWVWDLMVKGVLLNSVDPRIRIQRNFDEEEMERILQLGLLCSYGDPTTRPSMRQVVQVLEGKKEVLEYDREDMEAYLLKKGKTSDVWSNYSQSLGFGSSLSHPTFEDIKNDTNDW